VAAIRGSPGIPGGHHGDGKLALVQVLGLVRVSFAGGGAQEIGLIPVEMQENSLGGCRVPEEHCTSMKPAHPAPRTTMCCLSLLAVARLAVRWDRRRPARSAVAALDDPCIR